MAERALGTEFPISIATARAYEETFQVDGFTKPDILVVNMRTLFRNAWEAYADQDRPSALEVARVALEDAALLKSNVEFFGTLCYLYVPTYRSLAHKFRHNEAKSKFSPKQETQRRAENAAITLFAGNTDLDIQTVDYVLPRMQGDVLILSHYAIDLLNYKRLGSLRLLESHHGTIKMRSEWITKLSKNANYRQLPFNEFAIQLLGDGELIVGQSVSHRNVVTEVAKKHRWSPLKTSMSDQRRHLKNSGAKQELVKTLVKLTELTI